MNMRLRMAVIGVGHLGKEHARILAGLPDVELVGVADVNLAQAQTVAERVGTQAFADYWPLLNLVDAATIVVPTSQHAAVAGEFLERGIPLLVEKPLAMNLREADMLVKLAEEAKTLLQVGHIERFNPAFKEVQRRSFQPKFIQAQRLGPYTGRSCDVGVVMDLMIHDLDLLLTLVPSPVDSVEALGISLFSQHEDVANARLHFANGCVAELTASRASPTPSRHMHLWAPEGQAFMEFAQRKVTLLQPSNQNVQTLCIEGQTQDQLTAELKHFVDCVRTNTQPMVSGREGREAIALAERIQASLRQHRWTGSASDFVGPWRLPPALGPLFMPEPHKEVA
jgi:predicted dehydrogenase